METISLWIFPLRRLVGSICPQLRAPCIQRLSSSEASDAAELRQVVASLRRLRELQWTEFYRHKGFHWEAIERLKAPDDAKVHSLRLSQKIRALAFRDGEFLRFVSLRPEDDSAYQR